MAILNQNLACVKASIEQSQKTHNAKQSVMLLAVSKKKPVSDIQQAYQAGQTAFGENYLQEALEKINALKMLPLEWHFIGNIQSNKTRDISENFDWVHTVDRLKVAKRLSSQRPNTLPPLNVCIQVNIDNEKSKAGIMEEDITDLARQINQLPNIILRGLMAIPKPIDITAPSNAFTRMRTHLNTLKIQSEFAHLDTLSMGMSSDMDMAIKYGATIVRIGTAIFGERT